MPVTDTLAPKDPEQFRAGVLATPKGEESTILKDVQAAVCIIKQQFLKIAANNK
jgi:hypothetical protein